MNGLQHLDTLRIQDKKPTVPNTHLSLSPIHRFHQQTAVRYFKTYEQHVFGENYYTSDYDISGLNSHFIGTGIRLAPPGGILGIRPLNSLELRYGHYIRNSGSGMTSNIVTLLAKIK